MKSLAVALLLVLACAGGVARGAPAKGDGPTTIAAGYGAVWVGTGTGTVIRIDARTRRITHRLLGGDTRAPSFVHDLAVGFGSVWIARGRYDTLTRLDPRTNRTVDIRPRGSCCWTATLVEVGAGAVWVGDYDRNTVFRVDPRTNRVVAAARVPGRLVNVVAGPAGVWVATARGMRLTPAMPQEIRRLDPATNRIGAVVFRSECHLTLAVGSQRLWVSDLCGKTVTAIGDRVGPSAEVDDASVGLAVGEGAVWAQSQLGYLTRLDARSGRRAVLVRVRGSWLAVGAGGVWVLDQGDGTVGFVRKVDSRTNRVVGEPIRIEPR